MSLSADRNQARLSLPTGGRHSLVIPLEPVRTRRGDVEVCEICLPRSPQTLVSMMPPDEMANSPDLRRGVQCEWSTKQGIFQPAQEVASLDSRRRGSGFLLPTVCELFELLVAMKI